MEEKRQATASNDALKVSVLASGSGGNVTYVETPHHKVLVDAGLSGKKIENLLASIGRSAADLDSIFVTHEHSDHCLGVGVMARRYGVDVYANKATWQAMARRIGNIKVDQCHELEPNQVLSLGDLDIQSFAVSHDAANPQFYALAHNQKRFVVVTDTGEVDDQLAGVIKNADGYLFECNHDTEMLEMGPYSWALKKRIMSPLGHLSNEDGAWAVMDALGLATKRIYLGHLSKENNVKELAHLTVEALMRQNGLAVDHDFMLCDTDPEKATPLVSL